MCSFTLPTSRKPSAEQPARISLSVSLQLVEHAARFGQVEHAARDQIGSGDDARFLGIDRDDDHHDAVGGEMLAIAQHRFADVADAGAVDHHVAAVGAADLVAAAVAVNSSTSPFSMMCTFSRGDAGLFGQPPVRDEHAVLAVDRDEVLRPHEVEHQKQLFLRGVSGDVRVAARTVDDVRAEPVEVVDRLADALLVARESASR